MDSFVIKTKLDPTAKRSSRRRREWEIATREIKGKFSAGYRHSLLHLLCNSFQQLGVFPQSVSRSGNHFFSNFNLGSQGTVDHTHVDWRNVLSRERVSFVEFDSKGIYLASVKNAGCLSIHDFEMLYTKQVPRNLNESVCVAAAVEPVVQIHNHERLDVIHWNPTCQNEVGCVAERTSKVSIFDITYVTSKASEVLKRTTKVQTPEYIGFSDMAFSAANRNRVFACGLDGALYQWDRRASKLSCSTMSVPHLNHLSCLQLTTDEQVVFVGSKNGTVYAMDLRGGNSSSTSVKFLSQTSPSPLFTLKISTLLARIINLKAQTEILASGIQSVDLDPSCECQLAFHLNNGWSGVLNLITNCITHIHCPPPPWMNDDSPIRFCRRKPAWLALDSLYAVGASAGGGINILDFNPHAKSSCYVNYDSDYVQEQEHSLNRFIQTSECITACAAHPVSASIIGGTDNGSLVVVAPTQNKFDLV